MFVWESSSEPQADPQDGKKKIGVQITPLKELLDSYKGSGVVIVRQVHSNLFTNENFKVNNSEESSSNNGFSSQAWIAEIGLDITDRVNFAIQTTPDRDDLPPLGILTLQANPNLELLGSMDSEGEWKSQVQLFFRY